MTFLLLAIAYMDETAEHMPNPTITKAGGGFGLAAAILAWYNALAGIADSSNSFFVIPVAHFPWSETGKQKRGKAEKTEHTA